jgi:hypothetical protein
MTMFNRDDIKLDIPGTDVYQDSPLLWTRIVADVFPDAFAWSLFSKSPIDKDSMNRFLSVQTMRALFNDALAGFLSIPYISTSIRAPVLGVLMERKRRRQPIVDLLIDKLAPPEATRGKKVAQFATELYAPFFLGIALERSEQPQDILGNIIKYRKEAKSLRNKLRADRRAFAGRGHDYVNRIVGSINGFTDERRDQIKGSNARDNGGDHSTSCNPL